ncbi:isoprenoid biosynthesis glyoxalase ElbB [Hugenholtzia roseola]|uniref:isoprenoid biosynthesis glyoxalase ElbB n=1 Tax=Hugenholtzia roseola TaxID=1002 RepID=UPI00041D33FE|nr:isoprenoid biosynthesis glyoxalase ElbB [Hugenholtzia roseola]
MKIGVLLSGSGVYDGAEIHESVLTLLALDMMGVSYFCIAPDKPQHHVINHLTGEEMAEKRNVLVEAARIARGNITPLSQVSAKDMDGLVMPGGFGVAKNFTAWAFEGAAGEIDADVKRLIQELVAKHKPIAALCMSPTTLAKALEGTGLAAKLSVGTTAAPSPYDIAAISEGMRSIGVNAVMCAIDEVVADDAHNIVTTPCYMMEGSIAQVYAGIQKTIAKLVEMVALHIES